MSQKLDFMFADANIAQQALNRMLLSGLEESRAYFVAKPGTPLGRLNPANVFESTNTVNEGAIGLVIGGGLGLLAGILALVFPPWYNEAHWSIILSTTVAFGAVFGTVGMALMGVNLFNTNLATYEDRIANGEILMRVSVPIYRIWEVRQIMQAFTTPPSVLAYH